LYENNLLLGHRRLLALRGIIELTINKKIEAKYEVEVFKHVIFFSK